MTDRPGIERVLQVHTRYRQAGGEDQVVESERHLLEAAGITVRQVIFDNADLPDARSALADVRLAGSAIWSRAAARRVRGAIADLRPDVMHVHNTFAAASPSVFAAASSAGVPSVQTLHNYRLVCPAATAFRDGRACTDCMGRTLALPAVVHACVRGSRAQSGVAIATIALHRARQARRREIGTYIVLTEFQRRLMTAGGIPGERLRVLSNFLEPDPGAGRAPREGFLYLGRLSREKGIETLVDAAALVPGTIRVAGDGPMAPRVRDASAGGDIAFLGPIGRPAVAPELQRSVALVLPSIWFEGFPLVVLEAFATGTPVIASRIGALSELIDDGLTGLLVAPHDARSLAAGVRWAVDHPAEMSVMGRAARQRYEARFRGAEHLAGLLDAYAAAAPRSRVRP